MLLISCLALTACSSSNPYLEASLKPAELQGKDKAWFEKNWGTPDGKASRFFGGETWTYYRIDSAGSGSLYWSAEQPEVFALAADAQGAVFAATSPDGRIYRIAGGKSGPPLFNFSPNQCQILLKFDKEEKLSDYSYSGC
jgi:hypothetical protein